MVSTSACHAEDPGSIPGRGASGNNKCCTHEPRGNRHGMVAKQRQRSISKTQDSRIACLVSKHTCCTLSENSQLLLGLLPSFFVCVQDPWSWIVAILQDSMPSAITHLLLTFKFSFCFGRIAAGPALQSCRITWPHCGLARGSHDTHRGARTHDHKVKSLALCRLS